MNKLLLFGALAAIAFADDEDEDYDLSTWPATSYPCAFYSSDDSAWLGVYEAINSYSITTYTSGSAFATVTERDDSADEEPMNYDFIGEIEFYSTSYNYCANYVGGNAMADVNDVTAADSNYTAYFYAGNGFGVQAEFVSGADRCGADVEENGDFDDIVTTDFTADFTTGSSVAVPAEWQFEGDIGDTDDVDNYCWGKIYLYAEQADDGSGNPYWLSAGNFIFDFCWNLNAQSLGGAALAGLVAASLTF